MGMSEFYGATDDDQSDRDDPPRPRPRRHLPRHLRHVRVGPQRAARRRRHRRPPRRGRSWPPSSASGATTASRRWIDNRPEWIHQACDASLRRLGVDHIDLYYMHRRNPDVPDRGERRGHGRAGARRARCGTSASSEVSAETLRAACAVHPIAALAERVVAVHPRASRRRSSPPPASSASGIVPYSPVGRG